MFLSIRSMQLSLVHFVLNVTAAFHNIIWIENNDLKTVTRGYRVPLTPRRLNFLPLQRLAEQFLNKKHSIGTSRQAGRGP